FNDSLATMATVGYEMIANNNCMKVIKHDKNDPDKEYYNSIYNLWIDTVSHLILRYDWDIDLVMNNDTMHQYQSYELTSFLLNKTFNNDYFSLDSVPKFYKLKDYVPFKRPELLAAGEEAPAWELISLDGKKYSSKDFDGK